MVLKLKQEIDYNLSISACPHDCPSTCALEVTHDDKQIYKVKGASKNTYTSGVVCAKVSRYSERTHHPDRLKKLANDLLNHKNPQLRISGARVIRSMDAPRFKQFLESERDIWVRRASQK